MQYLTLILAVCTGLVLPGCRIIWSTGVTATLDAPDGPSADQAVIELPAEFIDGWIILEARVNGKGPYRFVFDTGAGGGVMTRNAMDEIGLVLDQSFTITDSAGITASYPTARADEVQIGPLRLHGARFSLDEHFSHQGDFRDVVGLIGHPGFEGYTLDIDYPNQKLRLHRAPIDPAEPGVTPLRRIRAGTVEIWVKREAPNGFREGRWVKVDSGGEFMLRLKPEPSRAWTHTDLARPIGEGVGLSGVLRRSDIAPLDGTLVLGQTRVRRATAEINSPMSLIGHKLLRRFRVRLDPRSGLAALTLPEPHAAITAPQYAGVGITSQAVLEDGVLVISLDPTSSAAAAGLRPGDFIHAVDGVPIATPGPHRRLWRLDPPPVVTLTIDRDETLVDLTIPTQPAFSEDLDTLRDALRAPPADLTLPGVRLIQRPDGVTLEIDAMPDVPTPSPTPPW